MGNSCLMTSDWTIDTNVLYKAGNADLDASYFLLAVVHKKHPVTFDYDQRIEGQYYECFRSLEAEGRDPTLLHRWFKAVVDKLAQRFSRKLTRNQEQALGRLRFDRNDWPFVAVCSRTTTRNLVTEDSDYTQEVKRYLSSEMRVSVLSIQDSLQMVH